MAAPVREAGSLWTPEEDVVLLQHVAKYGTRHWSSLKTRGILPFRDQKACCNRFLLLKKKFLTTRASKTCGAQFPSLHHGGLSRHGYIQKKSSFGHPILSNNLIASLFPELKTEAKELARAMSGEHLANSPISGESDPDAVVPGSPGRFSAGNLVPVSDMNLATPLGRPGSTISRASSFTSPYSSVDLFSELANRGDTMTLDGDEFLEAQSAEDFQLHGAMLDDAVLLSSHQVVEISAMPGTSFDDPLQSFKAMEALGRPDMMLEIFASAPAKFMFGCA